MNRHDRVRLVTAWMERVGGSNVARDGDDRHDLGELAASLERKMSHALGGTGFASVTARFHVNQAPRLELAFSREVEWRLVESIWREELERLGFQAFQVMKG